MYLKRKYTCSNLALWLAFVNGLMIIQISSAFTSTTRTMVPSSPLQQNQERKRNYQYNSIFSSKKTVNIRSSSSSSLKSSWEDILFNAQSSASGLADWSLSGLESSSGVIPVTYLLVLYFAGLLTSFSPCSLGLLPLTVSYISTAAGERSDKGAFFPTLAFAAGLAFVFVGLGLSVSLLGGIFGGSSDGNSPLLSVTLVLLSSGVSIAMGLQLLEIINIPLPSVEIDLPFLSEGKSGEEAVSSSEISFDENGDLVPPSNNNNNNDEKSMTRSSGETGSLFRTFLLGGSSALLASPCATPVLTSILAFVGASQNPILGSSLLFTYTVGYSTPLLLIGASGGQALAKAQAVATSQESDSDGGMLQQFGKFATPFTGGVLIWYGTNSLLTGIFGDPSLSGLSPVL